MQRSTAPRSSNINIRVAPDTLGLIDQAAEVAGKTRTSFILDTVKQAAVDTILDQTVFTLDEEEWKAFNAALDAPPEHNERLKALLARRPSWE